MEKVKCGACGTELTAEREDVLVERLQKHASEEHDMDMPIEKAREAVKKGTTE